MVRHRVMVSDGDCARRSAKRIASFHRFGLVTQVGFAGQSPLPKNAAYPYHNAYSPTRLSFAWFARMVRYRVVVRDGDCARKFFFNVASTPEICSVSLDGVLPIYVRTKRRVHPCPEMQSPWRRSPEWYATGWW